MQRRNFIKKALFSSLVAGSLDLLRFDKVNAEKETFGKWNIKEVEYLLRGFEKGSFYLVYFSSFIDANEFNRLYSLDGKYFNKDIYYYINNCIAKYTAHLIGENDNIRFIRYSQKNSFDNMIYQNNNNDGYDKFYEERIRIQASRYKNILKRNETIVYLFDYCEYKWIEPYEFRYFFREVENIPMYIINFTFKDFWCIVEDIYKPYLTAKVNICTPDYLGFQTEVKYDILNDKFME
ncbi:MAG: hypothetical protein K8I03_06490 [Ignavibacteria bacterium]|nr:hypothetical protein [Ignavibacteria bacterium]